MASNTSAHQLANACSVAARSEQSSERALSHTIQKFWIQNELKNWSPGGASSAMLFFLVDRAKSRSSMLCGGVCACLLTSTHGFNPGFRIRTNTERFQILYLRFRRLFFCNEYISTPAVFFQPSYLKNVINTYNECILTENLNKKLNI
jgi:hypothetical protein